MSRPLAESSCVVGEWWAIRSVEACACAVLLAVGAAGPASLGGETESNDARSAPSAPNEKDRAEVVQLTVNVPASMRPLISDDIAAAFAGRVADALGQQGCKARIHYIEPTDTPVPGQPQLVINLIEWQTDRVGNVDCTFSATLVAPTGKQDLGLFSGTSVLVLARSDWFVRSDQFDEAARQALSGLFKRIEETHLLAH